MQTKLSVFAVLLAGAALAVAALNQATEIAAPRSDSRVRTLQAKVDQLANQVEELRLRLARGGGGDGATPVDADRIESPGKAGDGRTASGGSDERINEIVDAAVNKKTKEVVDELKIKQNKKPKFDVLARTLELNDEQRDAARRVLIKGQSEATRILATPTQDGRNLMDDLIDAMAKTTLWPGKDHGIGKWFGRLMTETVPGTDETYGTQLQAVEKSINPPRCRRRSPRRNTRSTRHGA